MEVERNSRAKRKPVIREPIPWAVWFLITAFMAFRWVDVPTGLLIGLALAAAVFSRRRI